MKSTVRITNMNIHLCLYDRQNSTLLFFSDCVWKFVSSCRSPTVSNDEWKERMQNYLSKYVIFYTIYFFIITYTQEYEWYNIEIEFCLSIEVTIWILSCHLYFGQQYCRWWNNVLVFTAGISIWVLEVTGRTCKRLETNEEDVMHTCYLLKMKSITQLIKC